MDEKTIVFDVFTRFYRQTRVAEGYYISMDVARREATRAWRQMRAVDVEVFKEALRGTRAMILTPDSPPRTRRRNLTADEESSLELLSRKRLNFVDAIRDFEERVFSLAFFKSVDEDGAPSEVAVVRFTLKGGIQNYFHAVLKPEIEGDDYQNFRERVGDVGNIVRIKDTPNSDSNRHDLRMALLQFCDGTPLLVPKDNLCCAVKAVACINQGGPRTGLEVLDAEEVFFNFSQRIRHFQLPEWRITNQVHRYLRTERLPYLRCELHQHLRHVNCALQSCLSFAHAVSDLFPDYLKTEKKPISHSLKLGMHLPGLHYEGNGISEEDRGSLLHFNI